METSISTMWAPVTTQGPSGVSESALFIKHRKSLARWVLGIFASISISISFVTPAFAWLSVDLRCSELQSGTYPTALTCGTTPNHSPTPGAIYTTTLSGGSAGNNNSFSASASGIANYGTLGVAAHATATNDIHGVPDTTTMQLLSKSWSQWGDTFTIGGVSGTYVDIKVDLVVDISDFSKVSSGSMLSTAYLSFTTSYSNPAAGWCWELGADGACNGAAALHVGSNEISFTTSILAGTTSTWQSSLYAEAQVYNASIGAGEVNINALNTAHSYFTVLTEGATMGWTSGNDYSVPSAVPEADTWAMLLAGLGLVGAVSRRRKQVVI